MKFESTTLIAVLLIIGGCSDKNAQEPQSRRQKSSSIDKLAMEPQFVWLSTLSRLYPDEYKTVNALIQEKSDEGASILETRIALADALKPIMSQHKESAMKASDGALIKYLARNTRVATALLSQDVKACRDVFHGDLDPTVSLPDRTWKLMSEATSQLLIASHEGEEKPIQRTDTILTKTDYQAWRVGMEKAGADADTFAIITDPARKAAATPTQQCQVRSIMMEGALGLQPPIAAKITLNVLR